MFAADAAAPTAPSVVDPQLEVKTVATGLTQPSRATARRSRSTTGACATRVADNKAKYEITESESLVFGQNFGVTPDVKESPDGTLNVVSSSQGNGYEIRRK